MLMMSIYWEATVDYKELYGNTSAVVASVWGVVDQVIVRGL
jgi:hypothetical protein